MPKPLMVNAFDPDQGATLDAETSALLKRRSKVLGPSYKLFYEQPVHAVRAEGVWIYGPNGEKYLDVYNNVPAVGHCHPRVIEAVSRQMKVLNVHTRYLNDVVLTYAEDLLATFPPELSNVMFTCTGSEASDLSLRTPKRTRRRRHYRDRKCLSWHHRADIKCFAFARRGGATRRQMCARFPRRTPIGREMKMSARNLPLQSAPRWPIWSATASSPRP